MDNTLSSVKPANQNEIPERECIRNDRIDFRISKSDDFDTNKGKCGKKPKVLYASGRWTNEEHRLFLEGLDIYGKEWKRVAMNVGTRSVMQTRTHAQKYFLDRTGKRDSTGSLKNHTDDHEQLLATTLENCNPQSEPSLLLEPKDGTNAVISTGLNTLSGSYSPGSTENFSSFPTLTAPFSYHNTPLPKIPPILNSSFPDHYYQHGFFPPPYHHYSAGQPADPLSRQVDQAAVSAVHAPGVSPAKVNGQSCHPETHNLAPWPSPYHYYPNYQHASQHQPIPMDTANSYTSQDFSFGGNDIEVTNSCAGDDRIPSNTNNPLTHDIVLPLSDESITKYSGNRDYIDLLKSNCWIYHTLTQYDQFHFVQNIVHYLRAILKRSFFHLQKQQHHSTATNTSYHESTFYENSGDCYFPVLDPTSFVSYELCLDALKSAAWKFHPLWLLGEHDGPASPMLSGKSKDDSNTTTSSSFVYCDYRNCIQYPISSIQHMSYPTFVPLSRVETRNVLQNEGPKDILIVPKSLLCSSLTPTTMHHRKHLHNCSNEAEQFPQQDVSLSGEEISSYNGSSYQNLAGKEGSDECEVSRT
jgi:SHAQKYF class myb-like DNA-binding protein